MVPVDFNKTPFKLQYGDTSGFKEVELADLRSGEQRRPYYGLAGDALLFRAPVNGKTSPNSKYPRSELRELDSDGDEAGWSSSLGAHQMTVMLAFMALPKDTPNLVGTQIHDSKNDTTVFRLEGKKLYITNGNDSHYKLVTDNYKLGTKFEAKYLVYKDKVAVYYNGILWTTISAKFTGGYFKIGAYTQANCSNSKPCDATNYGEVAIYSCTITHTDLPLTPVPAPTNPGPLPPLPLDRMTLVVELVRDGTGWRVSGTPIVLPNGANI